MMKSTSPIYINVKGQLLDLSIPQVMGILNVTPDSFYAGSRMQTEEDIAARARQIIDEGAAIIDNELEMKVRDYECDLQGIVNNANYQHYLEHTRHEFLTSVGVSFAALHEQ